MKLKTIALILAFAATIFAAAPVGASWFGDIRSYLDDRDISSKAGSLKTIASSEVLVTSSAAERPNSRDAATPKATANTSHSGGGTPVSEPSNLLMLGLGIAGLIAGRYAAKRKRKKT